MPRHPEQDELIIEAARRLAAAPRGERSAIIAETARTTGLSISTVRRRLAERGIGARRRKRRADFGQSALSPAEAQHIAAYLVETRRQTGKRLADIEAAVETLRASGLIEATRLDPATGARVPLSVSAINRALKRYGCHPGQLGRPTPKVELRSLHPNHVWQIDPSLCVLYYLKREDGLRAMPLAEFNKNKPKNLKRIEQDRVWRYVFTDHASGAFYVEYVLGAESGRNLCETFIGAMQRRETDPFCGVPRLVMVDPGSANTGAMFKSLCRALGVTVLVNEPGQPWAKGQVEVTNDIIEREFEHRLKFYRVDSLGHLNTTAWSWMRGFQATAAHTRHRMTRYDCWQTIKPEQLAIPPAPDVCRQLAEHGPETRVVNAHLRISFRGELYDVRQVPGAIVGGKVVVARNPWDDERSAIVIGIGDDDTECRFVVPRCIRGEFGFTRDAVVIGEGYRAKQDTPVDLQRKSIERLAMEAATDEEAARKRKAGHLPFGGKVSAEPEPPNVSYISRPGTELAVDAPETIDLTGPPRRELSRTDWELHAPFDLLEHWEANKRLKPLIEAKGIAWTAGMMAETAARFPEGVPYDQIEQWAETLWQSHRLKSVQSGPR